MAAGHRIRPGDPPVMRFLDQIKGLSKDALVYGIGNGITGFLAVLSTPILTRVFVPAEFGAIALMQTSVGFFILLAGFNLGSGVFYYYYKFEDPERRKRLISTALFFFLFMGALVAGFIWLGAPLLEGLLRLGVSGTEAEYAYAAYLRILSLNAFFSLLDVYFRSILRMKRRPHSFVAISVLYVVLNLTLIVTFVLVLDTGIEGVFWAQVVSSALIALVGFVTVAGDLGVVLSTDDLKLILGYCLPQFPSVILNFGLIQINVFLLNYYASVAQVGYYAAATRVVGIFLLFTTAFRYAWDPMALSIMNMEGVNEVYRKAYTFFIVSSGVLAGAVAVLAKPALIVLTDAPYHVAYSLVLPLVAARLYQGANNILAIGINVSAKTKYTSYAMVAAFTVNLVLNVLLIPRWNAWGAAVAFWAGNFVQGLAYYYFAQRVYPIGYRFWGLHLFVAAVFATAAVPVYWSGDLNLLDASLLAAVSIPFLLVVAWFLGLDQTERGQVRTLLAGSRP